MIIDILYFIFFILLASAGYACFKGAPWAPTRKKDIERFLKLAEIKPGQKFYDLGCGDGRLIIASSQKGADAIGFEISIFNYLLTKIAILFNKSKAIVKFQDFWNTDLSDADIIYVFLMQRIYPKLKTKLKKELKPGTKIIVYAWPIEGWKPIIIDRSPDSLPIYLYQI